LRQAAHVAADPASRSFSGFIGFAIGDRRCGVDRFLRWAAGFGPA